MKKLNSKGSSPLHIVLIIIIVGLIAGVGYYVYNSQKKTNESLDSAANSQADPQKSEKKEESKQITVSYVPAGYVEYIDKTNGYGFAYPEEWGPYSKQDIPDGLAADEFYKSKPESGIVSRVSTIRINDRDSYRLGGAFGPEMKLLASGKWEISGGKYSEGKIGQEAEIESVVSQDGVEVFNYTTGDGPFSQTNLIVSNNSNVIEISLPSVCSDTGCQDYENSYSSTDIKAFASEISKSITQ